jgi:hypothetical protein
MEIKKFENNLIAFEFDGWLDLEFRDFIYDVFDDYLKDRLNYQQRLPITAVYMMGTQPINLNKCITAYWRIHYIRC